MTLERAVAHISLGGRGPVLRLGGYHRWGGNELRRGQAESSLDVLAQHDEYADEKDKSVESRVVDWAGHLDDKILPILASFGVRVLDRAQSCLDLFSWRRW